MMDISVTWDVGFAILAVMLSALTFTIAMLMVRLSILESQRSLERMNDDMTRVESLANRRRVST